MRALLLAAGEGRRLRPLTLHCPKPLLTVAGEPLIERHIRALVAAGIREIGVNLHHLGGLIERRLGSGERFGATLTYFHEDLLLDTGGAVRNAAVWLGDGPFVLVAADVLCDYNFADLAVHAAPLTRRMVDAHLFVVANPSHNPTGDFGLDSEGRLTRQGSRGLTYAGVAILDSRLLEAETRIVFPIRDALFSAAAKGRLAGSTLTGTWCDVGTVERLVECRRLEGDIAHGS